MAAALVSVLAAGGATAATVFHVRLVDSAPKPDEAVTAIPTEIRLWFSEAVEARLTTISVGGADSTPVTIGRVQADSNPAVVFAPVTGALTAGAYTVRWRTTSRDGHVVRGTYSFRLTH